MYIVKLQLESQALSVSDLSEGIQDLKAKPGFLGFFPAVVGTVYVLFNTQANASSFAESEQTRLGSVCISAEVIDFNSQSEVIEKDFYTLTDNDYPFWLRTKLGI